MLESVKSFIHSLSAAGREAEMQARLAEARRRNPVPVLWLFGKTQSGKTSIVKFLTGAGDAEVGNGFRPCTRYSRTYDFPTAEAPLLCFLDTRGLDEPGYDPSEDAARFEQSAHLVVVTVKAMDHAQAKVVEHLQSIRKARPSRPVLLALTCLHEAYPQQQHPPEYIFQNELYPPTLPDGLRRSISEQERRFRDLVDVIVPIDLTRQEEGFHNANYGGDELKEAILTRLPNAYRQTLVTLDKLTGELRDAVLQRAMPIVLGYSYLSFAAGAIPIPFVDLLLLPGIQTKMAAELAKVYGQAMTAERFKELAATLGLGLLSRQAFRELAKVIPIVGVAAGAALAGATTYALGRALCFYYQRVHEGHVPDPHDLKRFFEKELAEAQRFWAKQPASAGATSAG